MQAGGMFFFLLFCVVMTAMYVSIRRQWISPTNSASAGILVGCFFMVLSINTTPDRHPLVALFTGVGIGLIIGAAVLAVAWFFHSNELRAQMSQQSVEG